MRKIKFAMFLLLAMLFAGCINENIEPTFCRDGVLTFNMSTTAPGISRAEGANDDRPNTESMVYDLHYFLYPKGSADSVNATYAGLITGITANHGDNSRDNFSQQVSIPAGALNALFPNGATECDIYVIANYVKNGGSDLSKATDTDTNTDTNTSRAALKSLPIKSPTFVNGGAAQFVMDSEVFTVTRGTGTSSNTLTSETIYLTRAAAKIMIQVNVQTAIDVNDNRWEPVTEVEDANSYQMTLDFFNGVTEGIIDDDSDTAPSGKDIVASSENPYYHIENLFMQSGHFGAGGVVLEGEEDTSGEVYSSWITMENLYSYTSAWKDDESDAPYFKLSIPWRKVEAGQGSNANWVTYDYEVPVAINSNQLARNKLYLIKLNVGALGDLDYLDPAVYSYKVLDWNTVEVDAELSRPQYLVVDSNYVVMNNVETISVGYQSSDPVTVEIVKSSITDGNYAVYRDYTVSAESGNIVLKHKLDNTRGDDDKTYDYLVQTFVVRVTNTATGMYEDITFVQSPAMYVITGSSVSGSVFVNSSQSSNYSSSASNSWAYVGRGSQGSTKLYTIAVSAFDATTSNYLICDPREPANNNVFKFKSIDGNTDVATGTDASGDSDLTGYRATISGDASKNLVAPEFIIATGYGYYQVSWRNMYANSSAKYRCAGYQEAGYPAGRWRVPTPAELQVIGKLCAEGKIDGIFVNTYTYMSSNGAYNYNTEKGTFTSAGGVDVAGNSIRCVYDTWYWKDKCANTSQFIWGAEGDNLEAKRAAGYLVIE